MMLEKIALILPAECHLDTEKLSVIGVSGGPDSICLLHLLHHLGYRLLAVHVNHQLRPEASQEEQEVASFATSLSVSFIAYPVDVPSYAEEHSLSIEESARVLRYEALFTQAKKVGAEAVVVAHNADDQVETILMHLLRGSGLVGMRGMEFRKLPNPWSEKIALVRPLLSTWREEILAYLAEHQVSYATDSSNYDTTYFRNRLRYELLPYLEKYNPRIRQNLLRMSQINKDDYAVLQQLAADAWQASFIRQGPGYIAFKLTDFKKFPAAIQRYVIRKAIAYHLPSLRDIDFESVERGLKYLGDEHQGGQADLVAGLYLQKEGDQFWLAAWQADLPGSDYPGITPKTTTVLTLPCVLSLNDGWQLTIELENEKQPTILQGVANQDPFQAWVDLERLAVPLTIRSRKAGERFQPLGMQGHSLKISDLMINLKIPKRARATWPLICAGEDVIWIPGFRQGQLGSIRHDSRRIAHLSLRRSSSA